MDYRIFGRQAVPGASPVVNPTMGGYGSGAPPYVAQRATGGAPGAEPTTNQGWWGSIGDWIKKNPSDAAKIGLTAAGTVASIYGASKDRGMAEKQMATENAQFDKDYALRQQQQELNALEAQRRYESDMAERMRHRGAIKQIMEMYNAGKAKNALPMGG